MWISVFRKRYVRLLLLWFCRRVEKRNLHQLLRLEVKKSLFFQNWLILLFLQAMVVLRQ